MFSFWIHGAEMRAHAERHRAQSGANRAEAERQAFLPCTRAQFMTLPPHIKRQWWDETAYATKPPSAELREAIRKNLEAQRVGMTERAAAWETVSAMAGVDSNGAILPPPPGVTINRSPMTWWRLPALESPPSPGDECQCERCRR